jgi:putative transcriptional regulator
MTSSLDGLEGHLLVAVPQLVDPNFYRAVVLMLQHDEEGALGLVLNHRVDHLLADVASGVGLDWKGDPDTEVGVGGPVEPARGWVIHDRPEWDPHATDILNSLSLTTTLDGVVRDGHEAFGQDGGRFLFLLGYSGWGAGQIEEEIAAGSWVVVPVRGPEADTEAPGVMQDFVLDTPSATMWTQALESLGIDPVRLVGLNRSVGLH